MNPTRRTLVRLYLTDLGERVGWTFLQALGSALILGGAFDVTGIQDMSVWKSALLAAVAAVLSLLKGIVAKAIGDRNSASTAPSVAVHEAPIAA